MENDVINVEEMKVLDYYDPMNDIINMPDFARPLSLSIEQCLDRTKKILAEAPVFINFVKSLVPKKDFKAIISSEDSAKIAAGALELMNKNDGSLMAILRDPKSKQIVKHVSLKEFEVTPELGVSLANLSNQLQMAKVISLIEDVQETVETILQGQINDRLAGALSCQQKLLQALKIKNQQVRTEMLLRVVMDAEDTRNQLMLNQKSNLQYIIKQPQNIFMKMIAGTNTQKLDNKMLELRKDLQAINLASVVEVVVYKELGEFEAAQQSLSYYANYLNANILGIEGLVDRLDSLEDPSKGKYWSVGLTKIDKNIKQLEKSVLLLETKGEKDD